MFEFGRRFGGLSSSRTTWIRGDGNASTLTAQTMFNLSPLYNNWLQAWADVIRDDGVCHIPLQILIRPEEAPTGAVLLSRQHGTLFELRDTLLLQKYYPVMQNGWDMWINTP